MTAGVMHKLRLSLLRSCRRAAGKKQDVETSSGSSGLCSVVLTLQ